MEKSIVFIIGNGFNYLINEFINNYKNNNLNFDLMILKKEITELTQLWKEFDRVFIELKKKSNLNDEEVIDLLHSVLSFFNNLENVKKIVPDFKKIIDNLKKALEMEIYNKIENISNKFIKFEIKDYYKYLKNIFPDFGKNFKSILENEGYQKVFVANTNYDGIFDTLCTLKERNKWLFKDGFGVNENDNLVFRNYNFENDWLSVHLHGSYRFENYSGTIVKKCNNVNNNPVIIYNNPNIKKKIINQFHLLSNYFEKFGERIEESKKIVIIGNSLSCEPHIKELLETKLGNNNEIIFFDVNKEVTKELKNLKNQIGVKIIYNDTSNINSKDDFFNILSESV